MRSCNLKYLLLSIILFLVGYKMSRSLENLTITKESGLILLSIVIVLFIAFKQFYTDQKNMIGGAEQPNVDVDESLGAQLVIGVCTLVMVYLFFGSFTGEDGSLWIENEGSTNSYTQLQPFRQQRSGRSYRR